ncbi:MAG: hypothetical protein KF757_10290 [Phycisphaeraceae bacterium]|nr:hypothetical protein [Phycisphaeraceae bacterium]MCW5764131.1 hypothetical protein [Phycisphaeraceae bacterium]
MRSRARGALLFEAMIALAILAMASLTLGGIVLQSVGSMERTRWQMQACDLARSTMAMIEAGLADPVALHGPATRWDESRFLDPDALVGSGEFDDLLPASAPQASVVARGSGLEWFLDIETEAHEGTGLWLVTITARLAGPAGSSRDEASYSLRQLVRMGSAPDDIAGEEDELMDAARRGADRPGGAR